MHNLSVEKSIQKMWTTFEIFGKPAKVNNTPLGENSSNLVTLATM
jgi:hypothetical protein